jgi:hypothetical protein
MKISYANELTALLTALSSLNDAGAKVPAPASRHEYQDGWTLLFFVGVRGLSVVCHRGSYDLETAPIVGCADDWDYMLDGLNQTEGYREVADVAADIVALGTPAIE